MSLMELCMYIAIGLLWFSYNLYIYGSSKEQTFRKIVIIVSVIEMLGLIAYPLYKYILTH